jgi:hypothetical protein
MMKRVFFGIVGMAAAGAFCAAAELHHLITGADGLVAEPEDPISERYVERFARELSRTPDEALQQRVRYDGR